MDKTYKASYYINMKKNSGEIMTVLGIIITAIALITGYSWHHYVKKNDTPVEQMAETIIEKESGIKIDFSEEDKQQKGANPE
jgi:Tfp pilus assembly major pilin PilA